MSHDFDIVRLTLERDLIERADEPDLRLIWADLLQLDGDPLGTLIVLDDVGAHAEAEALRRQLQRRLWDQPPRDMRGISLLWWRGFVQELRVDTDQMRWSKPKVAGDLVPGEVSWLLRQPALRWVEVVRIDTDDERADPWSRWLNHSRLHNPILREIHVGRPPRVRVRPTGAWEPGGATIGPRTIDHAVIAGLHQLRVLSIGGERIRLPCRAGNGQTRLHHVVGLASRALTLENRVSLARALWDASTIVQQAAFETARSLGPRAAFLLGELVWFLRPPLSKKDPRPLATLQVLAAIGPASAALLGEVLAAPHELLNKHRIIAFMDWLTALGPAAASARPLLDSLLRGHDRVIPPDARKAIVQARQAIESP